MTSERNNTWALRLCIYLFVFRILGQLIQVLSPTEILPPLQEWQGSSLPYGALLLSQLFILSLMFHFERRIHSASLPREHRAGRALLLFGSVYLISMLLRFSIGLLKLNPDPWFRKLIPAAFHIVLASYILLVAQYHLKGFPDRK